MKKIAFFIALIFQLPFLMAHEPFIVMSNMKSGTFFLKGILEEATGLPSNFHDNSASESFFGICHCNCAFNPNFKTILLYRDPRDILISYAKFVMSEVAGVRRNHGPNAEYEWLGNQTDYFCNLSLQDQIRYLLDPANPNELKYGMMQLGERYAFAKNCDYIECLKFEDIIGKKGGSESKKQEKALRRVKRFLNLDISTKQLIQIAKNRWGKGETFRRGKIKKWQDVIDKNLAKEIKRSMYGPLIIQLGYEKNNKW